MADKTNDTNSDIEETPTKLYKPGYNKDGSKDGDLVKIGVHDISKDAKKTIGDFMSRVTKGKAGSAGKPNVFTIDAGEIKDVALTDPSTGLPAAQTSNDSDGASIDAIKNTGTTLGSFINTVDEQGKANFNTLSTGDFNNAEDVPGLATKEDKNGQKFGHTVLSEIEHIPAPSDRLGAPPTYEPAGSEIQKKISAVLKSNRFNPSPKSTPMMADNKNLSMGWTKQTELGVYKQDQPLVSLKKLSKVGHQMVVAGTGHAADTESMIIAGILPTLEQITGLQMLDSQDLRPRKMPAASSITENKGELATGESVNSSHGHLTSPIEPFAEALPVGMFVNTVAGIAIVVLAAKGLSELLMLFKPEGSGGSTLKPSEPYNMKKGRHAKIKGAPGGMLWDLLNVPTVEYPFDECMFLGILSFYGITSLPTDKAFDLSALIENAKIVAGSPGYYGIITRNVIRDVDDIANAVSNIPFGPDALIQIFNIVEALTNSATWRFLMQMAKLGNQIRMGTEGHPRLETIDVDMLKENATTRVKMGRIVNTEEIAWSPGSSRPGRMAWRHGSSPARYLLPSSFIRAATSVGAQHANILESSLTTSPDGAPSWDDTTGITSIGDGTSFEGDATPTTPGRLSKEYVQWIEDSLEAEYMPFYFHDLRTNEIISFHAFLGSYSDGFSTDYTSTAGYGRSDEVKIYNKTNRDISFDFTVAATSPEDLDVMYWNINKMVSMCYPQWSRGRVMTNGDDKFIQPFSQIPTASPMIRVRLGDMLKSNYSKFGLQRAFGLGNSSEEFNLDQATENQKAENLKAAKTAAIEVKKIVRAKTKFGSSPAPSGPAIAGFNLGGAKEEPGFGYAVGDLVMLDPTPTRYWPRTSDGKMGKEQKPSLGPEKKEGRLHRYPQQVEVEIVKRVPGPGNSPSGFDSALQKSEKDPSRDPGIGELAYLVKIANNSKAHESLGLDIDASFLHHRAEHSEIVGLSDRGKKRIKDAVTKANPAATIKELEGAERLKNFFDANKNFIVRSFESSRGRGLAGFITGLSFDWAEATWDIDPGRRAPKMAKISVSFAPIHDLHLGLDHNGMMTSVPFNVGAISNVIGGDPYDEVNYPTSGNTAGAQKIAAADGKAKKATVAKDPALNAAKKAAGPVGDLF